MTGSDQLRGMLGLCRRAGKLQTGADQVLSAIRGGSCRLALIDAGAAQNTVKKITDACIYYHVPFLTLPEDALSEASGRDGRMTAAVTDPGFARRLRELAQAE